MQGDEPFIQPEQILLLKSCFDSSEIELATLAKPFKKEDGFDALSNPASPKIVLNSRSEAIYFSRSIISYIRDVAPSLWLEKHVFYKHIGIYGYRADILEKITRMSQSALEKAESLEQLRWIESGLKIKVGITQMETIGIDTPEDMERALRFLEEREKKS